MKTTVQGFREVGIEAVTGGFGEYQRVANQGDDIFETPEDVFARDGVLAVWFDDDDAAPEEARALIDAARGSTHNEPEWLVAVFTSGGWHLTGCESEDCYETRGGELVPVGRYKDNPERYTLEEDYTSPEDRFAEVFLNAPDNHDHLKADALVHRVENHQAGTVLWRVEGPDGTLIYQRNMPDTRDYAEQARADITDAFPGRSVHLLLADGQDW